MREDLLKGLTEEQIKMAKACSNASDLLQLAKDEGVELTDEQLDAISGGFCFGPQEQSINCPSCHMGKGFVVQLDEDVYECKSCHLVFRPSQHR